MPAILKPRIDFFGNQVCGFSIQEIHRRLEITAASRVTVAATTAPALALSPDWEDVAELFSDPVSPEGTRIGQPEDVLPLDQQLSGRGPGKCRHHVEKG